MWENYSDAGNFLFTTQQLADWAGVQVRTIRWYHKINLLSPAAQSLPNQTLYGIDEVVKLLMIRLLQFYGFSLIDIRKQLSDQFHDPAKILSVHAQVIQCSIENLSEVTEMLKNASESHILGSQIDLNMTVNVLASLSNHDPSNWYKKMIHRLNRICKFESMESCTLLCESFMIYKDKYLKVDFKSNGVMIKIESISTFGNP